MITETYKPEIGEDCEIYLECSILSDRWAKVKCVGYDTGGIIWRNGSDTQSYRYAKFEDVRKYRSDYEKFEDGLWEVLNSDRFLKDDLSEDEFCCIVKLLYKNGYRKGVE